jgi:hypothetical protein
VADKKPLLVLEGWHTNRAENPLMNDLHEIGLRHGVQMVVLSISETDRADVHAFYIDHCDDTTKREAAEAYMAASLFLRDAAIAVATSIGKEQKPKNRDHAVLTEIDGKPTFLCKHCGEKKVPESTEIGALAEAGQAFGAAHENCSPDATPPPREQ